MKNRMMVTVVLKIGRRHVRLKAAEYMTNIFGDAVSEGSCTADELFNKIIENIEMLKNRQRRYAQMIIHLFDYWFAIHVPVLAHKVSAEGEIPVFILFDSYNYN